jgi:hypothetical protein
MTYLFLKNMMIKIFDMTHADIVNDKAQTLQPSYNYLKDKQAVHLRSNN